jgi:hypothetical protein
MRRTLFFLGVLVTIANFYRIDAASHSVSDTLISFVPETLAVWALYFVACDIIFGKTKKK